MNTIVRAIKALKGRLINWFASTQLGIWRDRTYWKSRFERTIEASAASNCRNTGFMGAFRNQDGTWRELFRDPRESWRQRCLTFECVGKTADNFNNLAALDAVYLEHGVCSIDGHDLSRADHPELARLGSELASKHFDAAQKAGLI